MADDLAGLKAFHGHLGPYAVAGFRLGRYALRRLQAEAYFGLETDVWCPEAPPPSCFLDGIQVSTGCTLGKRNVRHHLAEEVRAAFKNRHTGEVLVLRLRPEAIQRAVEQMQAHNDVAGARLIQSMTDEELLEEIAEA